MPGPPVPWTKSDGLARADLEDAEPDGGRADLDEPLGRLELVAIPQRPFAREVALEGVASAVPVCGQAAVAALVMALPPVLWLARTLRTAAGVAYREFSPCRQAVLHGEQRRGGAASRRRSCA